MPGGDRTGPAGAGPRTGRAMGFCSGFNVPGYANRPGGWGSAMGFGRGARMGRGMGRGFGRGYGYGWQAGFGGVAQEYPPYTAPAPSPEMEAQDLKAQAEYLKKALDDINQRIEQLDTQK